MSRSTRLGAFDAVRGACAARSGCTALISADDAFAELVGIDHFVPPVALTRALAEGGSAAPHRTPIALDCYRRGGCQ
ncbi:MAG TPA: hypothetical protein VKU89_06950 [Solirubrobacteraceae bacterium]|nr:hypothetical protein [Solirubrobacteraceae bacterium]